MTVHRITPAVDRLDAAQAALVALGATVARPLVELLTPAELAAVADHEEHRLEVLTGERGRALAASILRHPASRRP